jgi:hypothetical protein
MLLEFFEIDKGHFILGEVQHVWIIDPYGISQSSTSTVDKFGSLYRLYRLYRLFDWSPLLRDRLIAQVTSVKVIPSP